MSKGDIHTVKHGDGWANRAEGNERVSNTAAIKAEAQAEGREMAIERGVGARRPQPGWPDRRAQHLSEVAGSAAVEGLSSHGGPYTTPAQCWSRSQQGSCATLSEHDRRKADG